MKRTWDARDGIPIPLDGADSMGSWIEQELAGCAFADARLGKRFTTLMEQLSKGLGQTLPLACRFLDNDRVSEREILAGHFRATQSRFAAVDGPILVLHDTTEFSFTRIDTQAIGKTRKVVSGHKDKRGRPRLHTMCGILMHSSLAVTTDGLPLGLAAIKLWTRKKFKGTNALNGKGIDGGKHSINATRIPIEKKESIRWLRRTSATPAVACTSATGKAISTSCSASATPWGLISCSAPAWIDDWARASRPWPGRWTNSPSRPCTASR
jgi:hypothetical protein